MEEHKNAGPSLNDTSTNLDSNISQGLNADVQEILSMVVEKLSTQPEMVPDKLHLTVSTSRDLSHESNSEPSQQNEDNSIKSDSSENVPAYNEICVVENNIELTPSAENLSNNSATNDIVVPDSSGITPDEGSHNSEIGENSSKEETVVPIRISCGEILQDQLHSNNLTEMNQDEHEIVEDNCITSSPIDKSSIPKSLDNTTVGHKSNNLKTNLENRKSTETLVPTALKIELISDVAACVPVSENNCNDEDFEMACIDEVYSSSSSICGDEDPSAGQVDQTELGVFTHCYGEPISVVTLNSSESESSEDIEILSVKKVRRKNTAKKNFNTKLRASVKPTDGATVRKDKPVRKRGNPRKKMASAALNEVEAFVERLLHTDNVTEIRNRSIASPPRRREADSTADRISTSCFNSDYTGKKSQSQTSTPETPTHGSQLRVVVEKLKLSDIYTKRNKDNVTKVNESSCERSVTSSGREDSSETNASGNKSSKENPSSSSNEKECKDIKRKVGRPTRPLRKLTLSSDEDEGAAVPETKNMKKRTKFDFVNPTSENNDGIRRHSKTFSQPERIKERSSPGAEKKTSQVKASPTKSSESIKQGTTNKSHSSSSSPSNEKYVSVLHANLSRDKIMRLLSVIKKKN